MDLNEIIVFAQVVQTGSFVGAARALEMPKSTVSRKVSDLEARLGARLLQRTTRKLNLTDVGHAYYQHAARVVAEIEEAELAVTRMQQTPRGLLRVTAPLNFGELAPVIASFLERHPEVRVEMVCTDRVVDLVEEGFDVAIRTGQLADSTLISRSLGGLQSYLVASGAFLEKHGTPQEPRDLERFDCLVFGAGAARASWKLSRGEQMLSVNVRARLIVNDFDFLEQTVQAGLGIALLPVSRATLHLRAGRLTRVLPQWCSPETPVHAVYPSTRHLSPKVMAFLEHLGEHLRGKRGAASGRARRVTPA